MCGDCSLFRRIAEGKPVYGAVCKPSCTPGSQECMANKERFMNIISDKLDEYEKKAEYIEKKNRGVAKKDGDSQAITVFIQKIGDCEEINLFYGLGGITDARDEMMRRLGKILKDRGLEKVKGGCRYGISGDHAFLQIPHEPLYYWEIRIFQNQPVFAA